MLAIEIDGYSHMLEEVIEKDRIKEERLASLGVHVMHVDDQDVFLDMDNVLKMIEEYIRGFEAKED